MNKAQEKPPAPPAGPDVNEEATPPEPTPTVIEDMVTPAAIITPAPVAPAGMPVIPVETEVGPATTGVVGAQGGVTFVSLYGAGAAIPEYPKDAIENGDMIPLPGDAYTWNQYVRSGVWDRSTIDHAWAWSQEWLKFQLDLPNKLPNPAPWKKVYNAIEYYRMLGYPGETPEDVFKAWSNAVSTNLFRGL